MAISPQVMTTPRALQTRRNGRFPAVVRGARYSFFAEVQPRLLLGPQPHPLALALEPRSVLGALIVAAAGHVVDLCLLGAADASESPARRPSVSSPDMTQIFSAGPADTAEREAFMQTRGSSFQSKSFRLPKYHHGSVLWNWDPEDVKRASASSLSCST